MVRRPSSIARREHAKREAARREQLRRDEADRHFCDATFHFHHDDFAETASACELAVKLEPTHARACLLLCQALSRLGRLDDALDAATRAISLGHREGHRERGAVYAGMHERVVAPGEGTRASAESAESSESSSATSLVVSALSDLNVALRIDPSDVKALRLRARARRALGDGRRADEDDAAVARAEAEAARKEKQKLEAAGDLFVDDSGLVCVVCIDAPRDTRLMPCEHSALCGDCAKECRNRQGSCPICNTRIKAIEYGSFQRTFAPAEAKMHLARLASAVKKAKEQDDVSLESESEDSDGSSLGDSQALAGSESSTRTMPTLTPVSFESAYSRRLEREDTAGAPRPGTPERDFSEYTVGSGMEDDLEMPTTPVGNRSSGVFGDVAGFGLTSSPTPMGAIGGALARAEEDVEGPDTPPRE
jgi:tetratricopeptide (TPR) repeat protein